jgi:hypothetical protein
MNLNLALEAFDNLLINYPFHAVLWTLYAVNRRLAIRKPELDKSSEIFDYQPVTNPWLGGVTNSIRDVIAIDDTRWKNVGMLTLQFAIGEIQQCIGFLENG